MTVLKPLTLSSLTVACALAASSAASAAPVMRGIAPAVSAQNEMVQQVQWRRHGHHGGRGYYGGRGYHGGRGNGGAVAAGVLGGLAVGAMIGAAAAAPPPAYYGAPAPVYGGGGGGGDWIAYCSSKYRSFDPASGTYLGYNGYRHPCE